MAAAESSKIFCTIHSGPENFKKSRQKNSLNQINNFFLHEIAFPVVLKFFPIQKLILTLQKKGIWSNFREIDLFDFASFFLPWTFLNFLAHTVNP